MARKLQRTSSNGKMPQDTHYPVCAGPSSISSRQLRGGHIGDAKKMQSNPFLLEGSRQVQGASLSAAACDLPGTNLIESLRAQKSSKAPDCLSLGTNPHF